VRKIVKEEERKDQKKGTCIYEGLVEDKKRRKRKE
jgi:hypothetical protein